MMMIYLTGKIELLIVSAIYVTEFVCLAADVSAMCFQWEKTHIQRIIFLSQHLQGRGGINYKELQKKLLLNADVALAKIPTWIRIRTWPIDTLKLIIDFSSKIVKLSFNTGRNIATNVKRKIFITLLFFVWLSRDY